MNEVKKETKLAKPVVKADKRWLHINQDTIRKNAILGIIILIAVIDIWAVALWSQFTEEAKAQLLLYGFNSGNKIFQQAYGAYFENIPNKVTEAYAAQSRIWFNEETTKVYGITTLQKWEASLYKMNIDQASPAQNKK